MSSVTGGARDPEARARRERAGEVGPEGPGPREGTGRVGPEGPGSREGTGRIGPEPSRPHESAGPLGPEDRLQRALEIGYRYLAKRDRTEAEVRRHLAAKDIDEPSIDGAVEALSRQGYVDDARYATTFAEDRRALDAWGPERIERRMLALGIAPELIARALSDRDASDELEAAVALLRRRFPTVPNTDRERDRALGMLVRKGYDLELAYDAVRAFARTEGASEAA